jgi:hypothetical protein
MSKHHPGTTVGHIGSATAPETFGFDAALSTAVAGNGTAAVPLPKGPLAPDMLDKVHRYRRAQRR